MDIQKAVSRLKWRISQTGNQTDIDALNALIGFVNKSHSDVVNDHQLFAKLFIEKFLMLTITKENTAKSALAEIERILQTPVMHMADKLKKEMPMLRLNAECIKHDPDILEMDTFDDYGKLIDRKQKVAEQNKQELLNAFNKPYTIDEAINFIETQVNRLVKNYSDYDTRIKDQ